MTSRAFESAPGPSGGALGLLETAACLAATGHGPQASFAPIGQYLLERLGADAVLLVAAEQTSVQVLAAVPASAGREVGGREFAVSDWLAEAVGSGRSVTNLLGLEGDELGAALRGLGAASAAAVRVSDEAGQPLTVVAAWREDLAEQRVDELADIVSVLEAGVRVASQGPGQYAVASAAATAEQMAAVAQLAATLAHDLNNALAAILGQAELLLEELKGDPRAERVKRISGRTIQLMSLARALEEYADAQLVGQVEDADLGELARQAVEATRCVWEAEARARDCHIEMHCEVDEPTPIRVVPSHVKRSLVHLIFNAIQAIGNRDGTIRVKVWRDGSFAACSVSDDGVGMPPDVLRRCREPFFTTRPGICQGLGLSLAEATARRHGGDLEVRSAPGKGTTVTMYLPLRASRSGDPR